MQYVIHLLDYPLVGERGELEIFIFLPIDYCMYFPHEVCA